MIHHVFANRSNIGDWLSALGIQSLLEPHEIVEHLCDEPFVNETLEKLSEVTADELIVIGGGGLFMDYFTPFWEGFREIADHVSFCIWGIGYCDLKREKSRAPNELLEEIVNKSRISIVRDNLSRSFLSRCNLPPPVPCPSIFVVELLPQKNLGLLHVDNYTTAGADVYEAMDAYGREFAKKTQRPYLRTNNRIRAGDKSELEATLNLYTRSDLIISSALHGCIIGLAMGRRVVAVSGDYKIESFMDAAGLSDWVCDINEIDSLPYYLSKLPDQRSTYKFLEWARNENRLVAEQVKIVMET